MKAAKVGVIGVGCLGSAYAFALAQSGLVEELVLIDLNYDLACAHAADLNHGWAVKPIMISAGHWKELADADLIVLSASLKRRKGEGDLGYLAKNMSIFKTIIAKLPLERFKGVLLVATNPVDILASLVCRFSGLPVKQVIGSGTVREAALLRFGLGRHLGVACSDIQGEVIGEAGSGVPVWSSVNVDGISLAELLGQGRVSHEECNRIFSEAGNSTNSIIEAKGNACHSAVAGLMRITQAVVCDEHIPLSVSTPLTGQYGWSGFNIGVPALVGAGGVGDIVECVLSEDERKAFNLSAQGVKKTLQAVTS